MKKVFLALFIFLSFIIFSQEDLDSRKPRLRVKNGFRGKFFPFWGHIQQYKGFMKEEIDNSIIVTYPDFKAERYVNGKLVDMIKCDEEKIAGVLYNWEDKTFKCAKRLGIDPSHFMEYSFKFGFKKEDLKTLMEAEKLLGFVKINLKSISNGFELMIDWGDSQEWQREFNIHTEYKYSCNNCPYIFVKTQYIENRNEGAKEKIKIIPIIEEKIEQEKAYVPCQEYAYDLLSEKEIKCPYYLPINTFNINNNEGAEIYKGIYPYLFMPIVYDYNLPHQIWNKDKER